MVTRFTPGTGIGVLFSLIALLAYFCWHIYVSPSGNKELVDLNDKLTKLHEDFAHWQDKRTRFEGQVALLRPESLDPELLDEMARRHLGLVGKTDIVVPLQ
jgi:cell division protein FtsB